MMRKLLYISALVFLAVLTGCVDRERVSARLDALDSLLSLPPTGPEPPVNYGLILAQLDTLLPDVVGDDALEARWNLLCATAEDKADRPLLSDLRIRPAYDYYREATQEGTCGDSTLLHRFAQSCFYLGVHYYHLDSIARLEQLMQKSAEVAKSCNDHYTAYLALTYLSGQMMTSNAAKSVEMAVNALEEFKHNGDSNVRNLVCVLENVGNCYMYSTERQKALPYYADALELSLCYGDSSLIGEVLSNISMYYQMTGDYTTSFKYLQQARPYLPKTKGCTASLAASLIYLQNDSLEQAEQCLSKSVLLRTASEKYLFYRQMQAISIRKHDEQQALVMGDSLDYFTRMIVYEERFAKEEHFEMYNQAEKKKLTIESEKEKQQILFFFALLVILIVSAALFLILRQKYQYKKQLLALEQKRRKMLEEQRFLQLQQKETVIGMLKKHMVEKSEIIERLRSIGKNNTHKISIQEEDWLYLEKTLNDMDDSYVSKLRMLHPSLDTEDIRLAMLLRIGLTRPQVAVVFHHTVEAVKKRKQKLRKEVEVTPMLK